MKKIKSKNYKYMDRNTKPGGNTMQDILP